MPDSGSERRLDARHVALVGLGRALAASGYHFVTPTPLTHARVNGRAPGDLASDLRDVFGWSRPFGPGTVPAAMGELMEEAGVLVRGPDGLLRSAVRLSSLANERFFHSAYPTAAADSVFFGPDTYRFAAAIAAWLTPARAAGLRRAADIGTGAGPGGILVAKAAPGAAVALGDINDAALRLAEVNAALAGAGNAHACRSDLLAGIEGDLDLIVSNPPYLNDPLKRAYRHGGGPYGAGLSERILAASLGRLAPGGTLLLYTGVTIVNGADPFRAYAAERMAGSDVVWSYREVDPDVFGEELETAAYARADRIAAVVLTMTRKA